MFYDFCVFVLIGAFAFTFFYSNILKYFGKKYETIVKKQRKNQEFITVKCSTRNRIQTQLIVTQCFYQHAAYLSTLFHITIILFSPFLIIFTISTLVFSSYLITFIWFQNLIFSFRIMLSCFWIMNISFYITGTSMIARLNEEILKSPRPFYNILVTLDRKCLTISKRWKMSTYYELLNRSIKPLLINIGPFGNLTKNKILEVSLILSNKFFCITYTFSCYSCYR